MAGIIVLGNSPLAEELRKRYNSPVVPISVYDEKLIEAFFCDTQLDIVINCLEVEPDSCTGNPVAAFKVNTFFLETLAKTFKGKIIHISTDWVFDGQIGGNVEEDRQHILPMNTYGATKYFGEVALQTHRKKDYLIVRTSKLYGNTPWTNNQIHALTTGNYPRVLDVSYSPTYLPHFIEALDITIQRNIDGIIHISSPELMDEREFIERLSEHFRGGQRLPVKIEETFYRLGRYYGLSTRKAEKLSIPLYSVGEGLAALVKDYAIRS